jgi:acetolactate synthase-1/2/3 large subunit
MRMDGKGIIPEDHAHSAGLVGSYFQQCANRSVNEADLVVFIGSATNGQVTLDWSIPSTHTKVIQIDSSPSELGKNYPNALGVFGDARKVLRQMLVGLDTKRERRVWNERVRGYVREWRELITADLTSVALPIRPQRLCDEISRNLPEDVILVADTGYSCVWAGTMISITRPTQRFIRAAGLLGWAFGWRIRRRLLRL